MQQDIPSKMALFSYIAYYNLGQRGYGFLKKWACARVKKDIEKGLGTYQDQLGKQELIWGPMVHYSTCFSYASALIFIVRDTETGNLTLVIRGTNPLSLQTWLLQDLSVTTQVPWAKGKPQCGTISKGARRSLIECTTSQPVSHFPGGGVRLATAVKDYFTENPHTQLYVAGHSLGGLIAPTLALWLYEQCAILKDIPIEVHAFAGPTAGDAVYATYANSVLNTKLNRVTRYVNPFDIAPRAWNYEALMSFKDLYQPVVDTKFWDDLLIDAVGARVKDLQYTQIGTEVSIPSSVKEGTFFATLGTQIVYQHVAPYIYHYYGTTIGNRVLREILKTSFTV